MLVDNNIPQIIALSSPNIKTPTAQCDCACAEVEDLYDFSLNTLPLNLNDIVSKNTDIYFYPIENEYDICIGRNNVLSVFNRKAKILYDNFEECRFHQLNDILDKNQRNLYFELLRNNILFIKNKKNTLLQETKIELSVWLHITDRCNLRCDYCYLPHQKIDMSLETAKKAVNAAINTAKENKFNKIKIAGGEPLLRFPMIIQLLEYITLIEKKSKILFDIVILTNGTLLDLLKATTLKKYKIRLMLSLDGLNNNHDCQRKYINGKGSFSEVENALDIIQTLEIPVDISITVSKISAKGLAELTRYLLERRLFFGFNFYRENKFSKENIDLKLESKVIINGLLKAFKVIEEILPNYNLLTSLADRANLAQANKHTCSAGKSYLVFTPKGEVSQCQMQLDKTVADIDTPNLLTKIKEIKFIENRAVDDKEDCKDCEWKYWCKGGCPVETHRATGRYDIRSPNCEIYKAIFPEIIKLEAKRLIKYYSQSEREVN